MIRGGLITLAVKDVGLAARFYIETLGMKLVEELGSTWAVIDAGDGFRIALRSDVSSTQTMPVGLIPKVPLREAIAIFENRGISFDVSDDGPRTIARFRDPDGNSLYLSQEK